MIAYFISPGIVLGTLFLSKRLKMICIQSIRINTWWERLSKN